MLKFVLVAAAAWLLGVFGWSQIIGSLQNMKAQKGLAFTLVLWVVLLAVGAYVAIAVFSSTWSLVIGYAIALLQTFAAGKIQ